MNNDYTINQDEYNRFLDHRMRQDASLYQLNQNNYIEDDYLTEDEEENLELENEEDIVLNTNKKENDKVCSVKEKSYSLMISSIDRNLDDDLQNRYYFNVKFNPTGGSFSKKVAIYENSNTFLQTQLQRDKGIPGYPRDIDRVTQYLINNKDIRMINIRNELLSQPGRMRYNPNEPEGELIGYNIIYEHGETNSVTISKRFLNIKSIKINKVIIPNKIYTNPYLTTLYGNPYYLFPYIYLNIPELQSENYGSSSFLKNAFCILVPENKNSTELQYNPYGYTTYIPIDNNVFIYDPPYNGLNNITIDINFPNNNSLFPITYGAKNITEFENLTSNVSNIPKVPMPFNDVIEVLQINIIKKKLEPTESIWKRKATCSGVTQPEEFLHQTSIYDCPQGPLNKKEIYCYAIITNEYFKREMFNVGSMIKLINYDGKFNTLYQFTNDENINKLDIDYYIPNLFKCNTEEANLIWTNDELRNEAYNFLKNVINGLIGKIKFNLTDNNGIPIMETGYINRNTTEIISEEQLLNINISLSNFNANLLNNCYQYFNSFIYLKYLGLPQSLIPYCNVAGSNKYTTPICPDITNEKDYLYGMCRQITSDVFGDNDGPFSYTLEGFYNDINNKSRPQGIPITGSQLSSDVNSFYNQEICPSGLSQGIFNFLTPKFGTKQYYCEVQGISNIKDNCGIQCDKHSYHIKKEIYKENKDINNIQPNINKSIKEINTNYELSHLIKLVDTIYRNVEYLYKVCDYSQDLEIIKYSIHNLLNIELQQSRNSFDLEIEECYGGLEIFHDTLNIAIELEEIEEDINNMNTLIETLNLDNKTKKYKTKYWFNIYISSFKLIELLILANRLVTDETMITQTKDINTTIDNTIMNNLFNNLNKLKEYTNHKYHNTHNTIIPDENINIEHHQNKIICDNLCFNYSLTEGNIETPEEYNPSCLTEPNVKIATIEGDYPEYQNQNCNGMLQNEEGEFINEKKLCKGCGQYIKGSNPNGLCNVILIPVPDVVDIKTGEYFPLGLGYKVNEELKITRNLNYNPNDNKEFEETINTIAFNVVKQILFNGGPLSLQIAKEKKCKIVSISEQINISMNITTEEPNINKIIS